MSGEIPTTSIFATVPAEIPVDDEGAETVAAAERLDFRGAGVTVTDQGNGVARVTVAAGGGGVSGPVASTDHAIARWDGAAGGTLQDSAVTVDDGGNVAIPATKTVDGRDLSVDGAALDAHLIDTGNPHSVTAAQAGAIATGAAAGGDLGGTYPNPTVTHARGLRATDGGGTTVSMGSFAASRILANVGGTAKSFAGASLDASERLQFDLPGYFKAASDPAAPDSGYFLSAMVRGGRTFARLQTPSMKQMLQHAFWSQTISWLRPSAGSAAPLILGYGNSNTGQVGTLSHPALATTNLLTTQFRCQYLGATAANSSAGAMTGAAPHVRGDAAGIGGLFAHMRFAQETNLNGGRAFCGLTAAASLIVTGADPSAAVNIVGVGYDAADSSGGNWYWMHNDASGTATRVDSGIARTATSLLDLLIYCKPNDTHVYGVLIDLSTGTVGTEMDLSSNLPVNSTFLRLTWSLNTGSTSGTGALLDIVSAYSECGFGLILP